jgi:microcystin-dependent protein
MATVQSMTLARLLTLEADTVIGGHIDGSGHLILEQHDASTIDAGSVLVAVPDASDTVKGKVELATDAETITGTDTVRAVTPAGLAAAVGTLVPDASTTVKGKVELATTTEATTGTDTVRAVTPAGLKAATDALLQLIYPVGGYYISDSVSTNPNTLLGFGTWSAVQARVLIGEDGGTFTNATQGGAQTHTLATGDLPAHSHAVGSLVTDSQGSHTHTIQRDFDGASGSARWTFHTSGGAGGGANTSSSDGGHTHNLSGSTANTGSGTAVNHMNPWRAV